MRSHRFALLAFVYLLGGCDDAVVRIGVREARAAGTPRLTGAPAPAASSQPAASGGVTHGPDIPQASAPGEIVGFRTRAEGGSGAVRDVTFGQVFTQGQVPRGAALAARISGKDAPVQLDAKTAYADGSVRMAVLTVPASGSGPCMLIKASAADARPPLDMAAKLAEAHYDLTVDIAPRGRSTSLRLDAGKLLADALASGRATYWLRGPEASEARVDAPVEGSLRLVLDVRALADGSVWTDVQFDNDLAMLPDGGEVTYDATIRSQGRVAFQQAGIRHFQYQTWHREVWSTSPPEIDVQHDVAAMARAGAIQNYDLTTGVDNERLDYERHILGTAAPGVLVNVGIAQSMGAGGARPDIGPTTQGNTIWLMTQTRFTQDYALAQADAAGSLPWHIVDAATRDYITLTTHPRLWTDPRGGSSGTTGLTQAIDREGSGWLLDGAHQPDLSYVPYLMTGSRYRLDQLDAQASWSIASEWPAPRLDGRGILVNPGTQVRTGAWGLREVVEAAYADPDAAPLKPYFNRIAANNFDYLLDTSRTAREGEADGWVPGVYGDDSGAIAPWQQSYLGLTTVLAAEQGVGRAADVLRWQTNYLAGRFLAGDRGYSPFDGTPYNAHMYVKGAPEPFQTWREIAAATAQAGMAGDGKTWSAKTTNTDYVQMARAVLAGIVTVDNDPRARAAYAWIEAHAPQVGSAEFRRDPTWNIVPLASR